LAETALENKPHCHEEDACAKALTNEQSSQKVHVAPINWIGHLIAKGFANATNKWCQQNALANKQRHHKMDKIAEELRALGAYTDALQRKVDA
jgi:hypothetical protein